MTSIEQATELPPTRFGSVFNQEVREHLDAHPGEWWSLGSVSTGYVANTSKRWPDYEFVSRDQHRTPDGKNRCHAFVRLATGTTAARKAVLFRKAAVLVRAAGDDVLADQLDERATGS